MRHSQWIQTNVMSVLSVQIGVGYIVEMSIGPEKFVGKVVYGQGVGPCKSVFVGDDASEVGAVKADAADVGLKVPCREEKVADTRMDDDGPWV